MKKKLAFFGVKYFPSKGGVSRTTENLIRNLKDDFDITIYCYKNKWAQNNVKGVHVIQFNEIPIKGIGVFLYLVKCYFHMMFKGDYDIIHVRKIDAAFFIPLLYLKYKKILATSHESPYKRDKWNRLARLYFKMNERIFIRSKAKLTVISYPLSIHYKKKYNREVLFVPNGVEELDDYKSSKANILLNDFHIKKPYISFAARRIMATKGVHTMLLALNHLNIKNDIIIAGEANHSEKYINQIKKLSIGLNVKQIGYISDKPTLLNIIRQSEIFIFPSETEGMSIMLLEVALLGVPIIASDIPENTAVFNDDEVTYFKDKDYIDLANKIKWFYNNKDLAVKKSLKAKEKVHSKYSGKTMTMHYKKLYDELLKQQ